jgi:hypothetical protein
MHRKVVNIFMYVYDLFHILLSCDRLTDPLNIFMYVCMYVCVCVCIYDNFHILGILPVYGYTENKANE